VDSLAVWKKNHSETSVFQLMDPRPSADAAIFLNFFGLWKILGSKNPLVLDYGTIGPGSAGSEIAGGFHLAFLAQRRTFRNQRIA
jgi:hypothetical protein